jgi:hypothetical protein
MDIAEGNTLPARMMEWSTQDEYVYRRSWSEDDFAIFDNTGTIHHPASHNPTSKPSAPNDLVRHRAGFAGRLSSAPINPN